MHKPREIQMMERQIKQMQESKAPVQPQPHHEGKGTRARLNTAAEKLVFNSKVSQ